MGKQKIYDIIGVGIGPFNLGLAAILSGLPELSALFVERKPGFDWHPGLLLPTARMQVPYYADLVTIVNPCSNFTFHNFLHATKRFFRFANQENNYPLRKEYNEYCQWVAAQLPNLQFDAACESVLYDETKKAYVVKTKKGSFHGKHIVLGTGMEPHMPKQLKQLKSKRVIHAGQYLFNKSKLCKAGSLAIIGSGQSAAEIFLDLLSVADKLESLSWFTRSDRFHPMEVARFTTEMTSMDYIDHFFRLQPEMKQQVLQGQHYLYKGINAALIEQINEALYIRFINKSPDNVRLHTNMELIGAKAAIDKHFTLKFKHREIEQQRIWQTSAVIAATGYTYVQPPYIASLTKYIQWEKQKYRVNRDYSIDADHTLFVQNTDLHSHGFNSADLGMGPYRNAAIVNSILDEERFVLERNTTFQQFAFHYK
jgi:lysine N6-hydroxylase